MPACITDMSYSVINTHEIDRKIINKLTWDFVWYFVIIIPFSFSKKGQQLQFYPTQARLLVNKHI